MTTSIAAFVMVGFAIGFMGFWLGAMWGRKAFFWDAYDEGYLDGSNYKAGKTPKLKDLEIV